MLSGTKRWLSSAVTIAPLSSYSASGKESFGVGVTYDALIVNDVVSIYAGDGATIQSSAQIYVDEDAVVAVTSKITMPDSSTPRILHVQTVPSIQNNGAAMKVIYV